jgi:hypothetical protein
VEGQAEPTTHSLAVGGAVGALRRFDSKQEEEANVRMSHDVREVGGCRYPKNQSAERTYPGGRFRYCSTRSGGHPSRPNAGFSSPPHFARCSGRHREGHKAQCKKAGGIHLHVVVYYQ